jgi:hypothetical protein
MVAFHLVSNQNLNPSLSLRPRAKPRDAGQAGREKNIAQCRTFGARRLLIWFSAPFDGLYQTTRSAGGR